MFCGRARSPTTALADSIGTTLGRRSSTRSRYPRLESARSSPCPMKPVAPVSAIRGLPVVLEGLTSALGLRPANISHSVALDLQRSLDALIDRPGRLFAAIEPEDGRRCGAARPDCCPPAAII